jgi:hypothetical protein
VIVPIVSSSRSERAGSAAGGGPMRLRALRIEGAIHGVLIAGFASLTHK